MWSIIIFILYKFSNPKFKEKKATTYAKSIGKIRIMIRLLIIQAYGHVYIKSMKDFFLKEFSATEHITITGRPFKAIVAPGLEKQIYILFEDVIIEVSTLSTECQNLICSEVMRFRILVFDHSMIICSGYFLLF